MFCFPTAMLQHYSATSYLRNCSKRETGVHLHAEFRSVSPFSCHEIVGVSHRAALVFPVLLAPRLLGKQNTSRALVQDCCSSSGDCCVKNLCAFSWPQTGMSLPASTFLWGISHHFCPLQPQRQQDAGCMPKSAGLGEDNLQQTRDPH